MYNYKTMEYINIDEFHKTEIKMGKILSAEIVEGADKLIKFMVNVGEESPRQILSGIKEEYPAWETMIGKLVPVVMNLPTRKLKGLDSQGMILYAVGENEFSPIYPATDVLPGTNVS